MPLIVGIDEAGYGPLLGPLVIGATLWRVSAEHAEADLWELLDSCVCRKSGRAESRLAVGDSKKLYDRKRGLHTLERTVLAFAQAAGLARGTLGELLGALGFDSASGGGLPWYRDLSRELPVDAARSAYAGAAGRLEGVLAERGVQLHGLRAEVLTESVLNRRLGQTHNKASVLIEVILRLIEWGGGQAGEEDIYVHVDRLGGRSDYRNLLMQAFPERHLHVVDVSDECSRYRLGARANDWHLDFTVDGDQQYLPIALASMVAKYVRELVMEQFNAYWRGLAADLKPTAGYYKDAKRFLRDIESVIEQSGVSRDQFVRSR